MKIDDCLFIYEGGAGSITEDLDLNEDDDIDEKHVHLKQLQKTLFSKKNIIFLTVSQHS